jgi:1,4-alpha-glucan branching enzyme
MRVCTGSVAPERAAAPGGIYTSSISEWRRSRDAAASAAVPEKKPGRPVRDAARSENKRLRKRTRQFSRDYVHAVTAHWLTEYHVDGFRYDEVTDLYTEPTGDPYAGFAYDVYNQSLALPRFTPSGGTAQGEYSRVIQVPEALNRPQEVLSNTYSTATWQDGLLDKAEDMAGKGCYVDDDFAHLLDASFSGYPTVKSVHDIAGNPVDMPVNPVQYLNSHDHSHLLTYLTQAGRDPAQPLADRTPWYKIQPFVVA